MNNRRLIAVIVGLSTCSTIGSTAAQHESAQPQTLVDVVREATAQFVDPQVAVAAGYVPKTVCVTGPNEGAMGVHFVNASLVPDGKLDPQRPETLVYESRNGRVRLVAAEFVVFKADWEAQGN